MNFILKWLGFTTLKALIAWLLNKYVIAPLMGFLAERMQEAIDDPDTDLDDNVTEAFRKYGIYASTKKLKEYF